MKEKGRKRKDLVRRSWTDSAFFFFWSNDELWSGRVMLLCVKITHVIKLEQQHVVSPVYIRQEPVSTGAGAGQLVSFECVYVRLCDKEY